jgi:hypothetical protein
MMRLWKHFLVHQKHIAAILYCEQNSGRPKKNSFFLTIRFEARLMVSRGGRGPFMLKSKFIPV